MKSKKKMRNVKTISFNGETAPKLNMTKSQKFANKEEKSHIFCSKVREDNERNVLLRTSWVPIICQNEWDLSATNRTLTQMLTQILTPSSIQFDRNPRCYVVKNLNRVISDPVQRQNPSSSKLPARVRILTFLGSHWTLPSLPSYLNLTGQRVAW